MLLGIGDAVAGEAVHDEHLGREIVLLHQVLQIAGGIVDIRRVVGADLGARLLAALDQVELRVDPQVHVRVFQHPLEARQDGADVVMAGLDVDEQDGVRLLWPSRRPG